MHISHRTVHRYDKIHFSFRTLAAVLGVTLTTLWLSPTTWANPPVQTADDSIYQDDERATEPADMNPCQTCGTGAIAAVLLASLPVTAAATITLLVLTQTQVVSAEPTAVGPPIWAIAVGVSAAHTIVSLAAGIAFFRDTIRLCNSASENSEESHKQYQVNARQPSPPIQTHAAVAY